MEQILQLMEEVSAKGLGRVEIERAGFRVRIDGAPAPVVAAPSLPVAAPSPAAAAALDASEGPMAPSDASVHVVNSPIVGTYYAAPSPEAEPFVRVGDRVEKGQVICIVEAMKLMNEIEADASGVVAEIYARNGEPVEFGGPLIGLESGS